MYRFAKKHRGVVRRAAAAFAFVYAYFGFIAALHHTDGVIASGRPLVFSALDCKEPHPALSSEATDPQSCGVCSFNASLVSAALPIDSGEIISAARPATLQISESLVALIRSSFYSSRAPPSVA